jgi:Uma2 family endonuclease
MVTRTIALGPAFDNLADDTEETLVGSSFHQDTIADTYLSLKRYRRWRNLPWFIGNQTKLVIPRERREQPYQPSPDLMVYPNLGTDGRASIAVATFGPPALVIEVVSPSTALTSDLNFDSPGGKPRAYAAIGVAEYLTFDLFGEYIPEQIRAWRLDPAGLYIPWQADSPGYWTSALGISLAPQGRLLRIYDQEGMIIPNDEDMEDIAAGRARLLTERDRQAVERDRVIAERDRQIAKLQAELRRLRGEK